jgi:hypothetical protein
VVRLTLGIGRVDDHTGAVYGAVYDLALARYTARVGPHEHDKGGSCEIPSTIDHLVVRRRDCGREKPKSARARSDLPSDKRDRQ